ncbi:hypothetical protein QQP08_023963 [Theobroma cacao]|nr:hypothetical protein QQP08_023963 [Theobroma cacao]
MNSQRAVQDSNISRTTSGERKSTVIIIPAQRGRVAATPTLSHYIFKQSQKIKTKKGKERRERSKQKVQTNRKFQIKGREGSGQDTGRVRIEESRALFFDFI